MVRFVPCLDPPPLPADEGDLTLSAALIDHTGYISAAAVSNATTAVGTMSPGTPIHVSFCLARPPRLSYLCVHFPGAAAGRDVGTPGGPDPGTPAVRCAEDHPRVLATHADLALIRVHIPGEGNVSDFRSFDYFVYTARPRPGESSLRRLPSPHAAPFQNNEVAVLRCPAAAGDRFVVAGLRLTIDPRQFLLQRYDSAAGRWTSTRVVAPCDPERDRVLPIPAAAPRRRFHDTAKAVVLGPATVGWVDLWRGILFCDVLSTNPVLRDMPLPKPARANRRSFCKGAPYPSRDLAVVTLPTQQQEIRYLEMETRPGELPQRQRLPADDDGSGSNSDSDSGPDINVAMFWKATVWTMPVPVTRWADWRKDCAVDVTDIAVDDPRLSELLLRLPVRLGSDPEEAEWSLRRLDTGHPALGLGVDSGSDVTVYFLADSRDGKDWAIAVDVRGKKLLGMAQLDDRKNCGYLRCHYPTDISKHLANATEVEQEHLSEECPPLGNRKEARIHALLPGVTKMKLAYVAERVHQAAVMLGRVP
ncbi:hypothetical protein ACP4OV_022720 [Aristida adscensionis]